MLKLDLSDSDLNQNKFVTRKIKKIMEIKFRINYDRGWTSVRRNTLLIVMFFCIVFKLKLRQILENVL